MFDQPKICFKFARSIKALAYGVIGNTAGFGPVVLGSSPSRPTKNPGSFTSGVFNYQIPNSKIQSFCIII